MVRKLAAAASIAVLATTTMGVGAASATTSTGMVGEQTAGIDWFGHRVHVRAHHPDQAVVAVRYRCEGIGVHLWASVKQGPGVNAYEPTAERPSPPSDVARAWYETPDEAVPTCDGTSHTLRYTISRATEGTETHPGAWQRLRNGRAWAQFVVFSVPEGSDPADPNVVPNREAFAGWVRVVRNGHCGHNRG
jgi:hypothetical protein